MVEIGEWHKIEILQESYMQGGEVPIYFLVKIRLSHLFLVLDSDLG